MVQPEVITRKPMNLPALEIDKEVTEEATRLFSNDTLNNLKETSSKRRLSEKPNLLGRGRL